MIKNKFYEAPEAELIFVRVEEGFLQTSRLSSKGTEFMSIDEEEDF